ncbi:MAG: endonuclease domain-containing protein [Methylobacter sp.]|nr:endonuclease domain-containing protein [Methylobacter sp.]
MKPTSNARLLRKNQTDVEHLLWQKLRNRQILNFKFRRQFPIDPFIVDFCCLELKLIIELDGSQHFEQVTYDEKRSVSLGQRGFKVIRFWNNDVINNIEGVLEKIYLVILEITGKERWL